MEPESVSTVAVKLYTSNRQYCSYWISKQRTMLRFWYQASCRVKYGLTRSAHTQISAADPTANPSFLSSQRNGSQLCQERSQQQNQHNPSAMVIKIHLMLPLHAHLHLFHSFETRGLGARPNHKVTEHFHGGTANVHPLTCCRLESHYRQCKSAGTQQLH